MIRLTNAIFYKGVDAADYANEIKNNNNSKHKVTSKRRRLFVRFVDLILLLAILRFLSSLLRSLTASFSSDTVSKLVALGWVVHLFGKEIKLSLKFLLTRLTECFVTTSFSMRLRLCQR